MNTITPLFQGTELTTSAIVYYTSPAPVGANITTGTYTSISNMTLTNIDTVPHTITIYLTPSANIPTTSNILISNKTVASNETFVVYQAIGSVLAPGNSIQAFADVGGMVIFAASGIQFS